MSVAEVSIVPIGEGPSISKYVKKAIEVFKKYNLKVEPCAMGTVLEGDLDEIIRAFKEAHETVLNDTVRVLSTLKIDDRKDKEITIEGKLKAIGCYKEEN
ncbi:MTH1187 family thiamine-binding protein [Methanothermococcus sp. SCGC AD-155-N22]|nr:MTH1187 family thiamine-binding protein [Methanothermococcus sp. SCGC AD-155-N22]